MSIKDELMREIEAILSDNGETLKQATKIDLAILVAEKQVKALEKVFSETYEDAV